MLLGVWSSGSWPGLVDADGGGFGPGAGAFRPDGADVETEEVTDGEAGEVDADGAVGGDGEGFPRDGIGVGDIRDELIFVEGGIFHAAPAGLHATFKEGVLQAEAGGGGDGLRSAGAAAEGPADA